MSVADEWKEENIGEGLKLLSGYPFSSNKFSDEDGFPLIRIRDIVDSSIETFYRGSFLPMYVIKHGDMLVGMDGNFHLARWNNQDALLNQRVLKIDVLDSENLDRDFVYYWLQPYVLKVNELTAATTVKHLSTKDIRKAKSKIPSLLKQRKIGRILRITDQAIKKTEALIEKYQQIKAGLMQDLFTRGISADGKFRPAREQAPELYQEAPIGWIPKDWKETTLSMTLSRIDSGWSPACPEVPPGVGEWGVLKVSAVTKGFYDPLESKTLPPQLRPIPSLEVQDGDVILTRANGVAELVGKTVQVRNTQDKLMLSDKLLRLVPKAEEMTNDYLALLMCSSLIKTQIERTMSGSSGQRNISQSEIRSFGFYKPQKNEQILIAQRIGGVESLIVEEKNMHEKLQSQKKGLMVDLLTGKVSVKIDAPEVSDV